MTLKEQIDAVHRSVDGVHFTQERPMISAFTVTVWLKEIVERLEALEKKC